MRRPSATPWLPSGPGFNYMAHLRIKVSENAPRQRQCRKCLITLTSKSRLPSWRKEAPRTESRSMQERGRSANACLSGHYRTETIILRQSININEGNQMSSALSLIWGRGRTKHCHTLTTRSTPAHPVLTGYAAIT
ncbi:hypothetical protein CEXT_191451 [Caerostris extrusa]|uniref:Uncharacterized protein n=1 Tax=Caerostris extrusa TaxID=172846 RepID=A0AAV4YCB3_CAEEX|nr:hypothetical protein CEXT_191451 [Caerostris extrusa]